MRDKTEPLLSDCAPRASQVFDYAARKDLYDRKTAEAFRLCGKDSRNPESHLALGKSLCAQHLFIEAIDAFSAGSRIDPFDWQLHAGKGVAYLKLERLDEAVSSFALAGRIRKESFFISIGHGISCFLAGNADAADRLSDAARLAETPDQVVLSSEWNWIALSLSGKSAGARASLKPIRASMAADTHIDSLQLCWLFKGIITIDTALSYFANRSDEAMEDSASSGPLGAALFLNNGGDYGGCLKSMEKLAEKKTFSLSSIASRNVSRWWPTN